MSRIQVSFVFRIHRGGNFVREVTLSQPVIKIGKLSSSHLRLEDDSVSRMHAVIEVSGEGTASIVDLGSSRGTLVNGQKIAKTTLRSGDHIDMGDTRIDVAIHALGRQPARPVVAAPPAPPRPVPENSLPNHVNAGMTSAPASAPAPIAHAAPLDSFATGNDDAGTGAVEVAAMMGDSVVGVKHVMNPRGGVITRLTYGLFAAGALMLITAGVAFTAGVKNAEFNKTSKEAWIQSQRPVYEWRPRRISPAYDWMAFGGLAAGLTCLTMGLIRVRNERQSPFFRIGHDPEVEFPTSEAPASAFPLVAPRGDDFICNVTRDMDGEVTVAGHSTSLSDLYAQGRVRASSVIPGAFELPIAARARIKVRAGKNTFLISPVARPRQQAVPLFGSIQNRVLAFAGGSAVAHLCILGLLNLIPPDPTTLSLDTDGQLSRISRSHSLSKEDPREQLEEPDKNDGESGSTGTAMALPGGKMGQKNSERTSGQYNMKKRGDTQQLAREEAIQQAIDAGILGALRTRQGGAFASLTATGAFSSGLDDADVYGGMLGDEVGEMNGGFGFAPSGFGPGGNGTGWGTIGTGRYNTLGHGDSTGEGFRGGVGDRHGMKRRAGVPDVRVGHPVNSDGLDKNIIRRYVRRKIDRIRYCYEKQLLTKPGIAGTVMSEFQISPQGTVLSSKAAGVDNDVSSCVAHVIGTITFPKPNQSALVQVRYPFTFRPTGA